jgi:hypothetical protein
MHYSTVLICLLYSFIITNFHYCRKDRESTTPRKFPREQIVTTPIKHFFKAGTTTPSKVSASGTPEKVSIGTPGKLSIGTPNKRVYGGSPKGLRGVISPKNKSPKTQPLSVKSPESKSTTRLNYAPIPSLIYTTGTASTLTHSRVFRFDRVYMYKISNDICSREEDAYYLQFHLGVLREVLRR